MAARSIIVPFVLLASAGCSQADSLAPASAMKVTQTTESAADVGADAATAGSETISRGLPVRGQRKIIYTATLALVVEDLQSVDQEINRLVSASGGYLSEFHEDRSYGDHPLGHWVVRIPSDQFESFLDQVVQLGVPEDRRINAQDVTEEHIDLERRLDNKRRLEERILGLLERQTGDIKDVIEIETQLARVREEIERMEGRLRFLNDQIALTTITITARVEEEYTPPQAPTFVRRIASTFSGSIDLLLASARAFVLAVVAVFPWLVVLSLIGVPLLRIIGRRRHPRGLD